MEKVRVEEVEEAKVGVKRSWRSEGLRGENKRRWRIKKKERRG